MESSSDPIAQLCDVCLQGALFRDDTSTLYETVDDIGRPILAKWPRTGPETQCTTDAQWGALPEGVIPHVPFRKDVFPDVPALAASAEQGCGFCAFLKTIILSDDARDEMIRVFGPNFFEQGSQLGFSILVRFILRNGMMFEGHEDRGHGLLGAQIRLDFEHCKTRHIVFSCFAEGVTGSDPSDIWLGLSAPSSQAYHDKDRVEWITTVFEREEEAKKESQAVSIIPERLIYVGSSTPRLVVTAESRPEGEPGTAPRYAALSYCWGAKQQAKQQLTTTKVTIARRKTAITDDEMTEVVRDAVAVTRILGIAYIWIDALCILQDDITDWQRQCVDVARLYAGAAVTICAASSTSCLQGFLRQRGTRIRMPFVSSRRPELSGSFYLQFKYVTSRPGNVFFNADADILHCRWSHRGWTFQENVASSRKLVFGNANIHYYSPVTAQSMGSGPRERFDSSPLSRERPEDLDDIHSTWGQILINYSRLGHHSLQTPRDILPAISGLASHYHTWLQEEYNAGLWKGDLLRGLMWTYDLAKGQLPSRHAVVPRQYFLSSSPLLPSWSPLGGGRAIAYRVNMYGGVESRRGAHARRVPMSDFEPAYETLVAHTKPSGSENPFGDLESDWGLEIRSRTIDMSRLEARDLELDDLGGDLEFEATLEYRDRCLGRYVLDFYYTLDSTTKPSCSLDEIASFTWVLLGSCRIAEKEDGLGAMQQPTGAFGLILLPIPDSDKFFRAGVFFPGFPDRPHDGLALFEELGEIKTITVV